MPTFNANIPQPTDILSDSQDDILQNFQQLDAAWNINHVAFNGANQGKHNQVTLPENAAPTNTLINEANIYAQQSALTGNTELAWQRENNGSRIEFTGLLSATDGWTRLPSGILLKWGLRAVAISNPIAVVFPVAVNIPVFQNIPNNPFTIFLTPLPASGLSIVANIIPGSITNLGFNARTFLSNTGAFSPSAFFYLAIGI